MVTDGRFPTVSRMRRLLRDAGPYLTVADRARVNAALAGHALRLAGWGALMALGVLSTGACVAAVLRGDGSTVFVVATVMAVLVAHAARALVSEARRRLHLVLLLVLPLVEARRSPGGSATPTAITVGAQPVDAVWNELVQLAGPGESPPRRGGCLAAVGMVAPALAAAYAVGAYVSSVEP